MPWLVRARPRKEKRQGPWESCGDVRMIATRMALWTCQAPGNVTGALWLASAPVLATWKAAGKDPRPRPRPHRDEGCRLRYVPLFSTTSRWRLCLPPKPFLQHPIPGSVDWTTSLPHTSGVSPDHHLSNLQPATSKAHFCNSSLFFSILARAFNFANCLFNPDGYVLSSDGESVRNPIAR